VDDPALQCRLIRPQEISRYVELGLLDAGITGYDWIYENNSDVHEVSEMCYSKATSRPVRWVLAGPNDSTIQSVKDLQGKRVATEAVGLTRRYLAQHNVEAEVEFSWGATEVKAPELVDAIVELTETGSSLPREQPAHRRHDPGFPPPADRQQEGLAGRRKARQDRAARPSSPRRARRRGPRAHQVERALRQTGAVSGILPSLHAPTINKLNDADWFAVESVVEEKIVRDIVPPLREAGATGIIELPLNKVIF
jgi:ATP phosphoribosyltransferase